MSDCHHALDVRRVGGPEIVRPGVRGLEDRGLAWLVEFLDTSERVPSSAPGMGRVQLGQGVGVERDEMRTAVSRRQRKLGEEGEARAKGEDELGRLLVVLARKIGVHWAFVPYQDATAQAPVFPGSRRRGSRCASTPDMVLECGARDDEQSTVPRIGPIWGVARRNRRWSQYPHKCI